MPVEAMALGTPVVVNRVGGARESVERLGLGAVTASLGRHDLRAAVEQAAEREVPDVRDAAVATFGESRFRHQIREWVNRG
nr:hypothetical protein [Xylanimonas allomyrinae]